MFSLLFGTGMRLGEVCNLRIQDIDGNVVRVKGKGQKVREIYLPEETAEAINDYLNDRTKPLAREDQDYLFTSRAGNRMSYNFFRKITADGGMVAGIKFHPHMAKHTHATMLLRKGVSEVHVSHSWGMRS
jgi:integrase/recombinase XerC